MNKVGRIGAILAATVAAAGMTSMAVASPASASPQGPRPVSNWLRAVPAHASSWINIYWRTDRPVCDARIWVDGGRRVDVEYRGHRSYTTFSHGDSLRPGRVDYSTIRVEPNVDRSGVALLRTTITYTNCGFHNRASRNTSVVTLPVLRGHGNSNGHGNDGRGNNDGHNGQNHDGQNQGQGYNGQGSNNGQGSSNGQGTSNGQGSSNGQGTNNGQGSSNGQGTSNGQGSSNGQGTNNGQVKPKPSPTVKPTGEAYSGTGSRHKP